MEHLSKALTETEKIAENFLKSLSPGQRATIIGLYGDLGTGKTTFVKGIAKALNLQKTVSSPTFVIEKIYKLENENFKHLIHIDAYRLKNGEELLSLGWKEISRDPDNLIFIEWPENVSDILPEEIKKINFKFIDDKTRQIKL